jgi:hypothetical protein
MENCGEGTLKGVIGLCLSQMVTEKFGLEKWQQIATRTGLKNGTVFLAGSDYEDQTVLKLVESTCAVLNITLQQAADAFGDYWVNVFAPKLYAPHYNRIKSAREFLLKMDSVHETTTRNITNAKPPRFEYEWKDPHTLLMTYKSQRNLIDFLVGLIKGVGIHFNEKLEITKLNNEKVQIVFAH